NESLLAGTNHRCAGNHRAQLIGAQQSAGQFTVGQYHKEFLSAIAANAVVDADLRAQAAADFAEGLIAKKMAEGVVHVLEMVDVAKNHCDRLALAARSLQFALEHGDDLSAIHQSGKRIV